MEELFGVKVRKKFGRVEGGGGFLGC